MGVTLTDVLLFGKAQSDDVDNATLVIYRRNILRWSALGGYLDIIVKGVSPLSLPDAVANSLSYVKAFGGTEQRDIPDNYLQRQYIYMMDESYLLTDIVPTYDGRYEMDFQTTTTASQAVTYLGARTGGTGNQGLRFAHVSNKTFRVYGFGSALDSTEAVANDTRYKFVWNNQRAILTSGDTTVFDNTFTNTGTTADYLAINGWNNDGVVSGNIEGIYLYSFKAWNAQGELVADYVPAVQKGTVPVVGFYDTVSKTFKTPTAGTFAAGPEAVPTPDAPMDIVSNNGVLKLSPNLVDFNETRINSNTWASADKTKGFEVYADVYGKTVGNSMLTNANCFGVFVPCKQGESVSLNFFDYTPRGLRTYYCEITADSKCNTAPVLYYDGATATFVTNTLTLTQADSIGFVIEFEISAQQERTYDATNYMVVRGTTTPAAYIPYGQIYTDGTVETINAHGKNLFDKDTSQTGYYKTDGTFDTSGNYIHSIYIPVTPGTTYTLSGINRLYGGKNKAFCWYSEDYSYLSANAKYAGVINEYWTLTATVPSNAKYMVICCATVDTDVQLELGSTATEYTPYYDGGTATAEMLLKVGDYQDEQELISGVVTKKVGIKVFDGTEDWRNISGYFNLSKTDLGSNSTVMPSNSHNIICSHFETKDGTFTDGIGIGGIYVNFKYDSITTVLADWKTWLANQYAAGTPVIVIYPLATATTESVAGQALQVTDGDNVLEITQASLNNLELEAKYQAAVSLTIQEVQDANLDPNVEVTIN